MAQPVRPRAKMTIPQQEELVRSIVARCQTAEGEIADATHLTLSAADAAELRVVADTLLAFDFYGAADFVRNKAKRRKRK